MSEIEKILVPDGEDIWSCEECCKDSPLSPDMITHKDGCSHNLLLEKEAEISRLKSELEETQAALVRKHYSCCSDGSCDIDCPGLEDAQKALASHVRAATTKLEADRDRALAHLEVLRKPIVEFIHKVESGVARSTRSYGEMKKALAEEYEIFQGKSTPPQADLEKERWPVGTPVIVTKDNGSELETVISSEPWTLNGFKVILVKGISGCYLLSRVRKTNPKSDTTEGGLKP